MDKRGPLRMVFLVLVLAIGGLALEGVQMILPNGSRVVVAAEDIAIDVTDAAGRALPEDEGELKNLLNWAISHSDPEELKRQAASGASKEAIERRQQVQQAIKRMQEEPTEAELMIEAIEVLGNDTSDDAEKLGALQALQILLEPIDNANDLHKLGGIEVVTGLLEDNNSDAVRAGAAFALGVAASSNEPFIVELRQRGGEDVMIHFVEIAEMEDMGAAAKGLYGMSKLMDSADQRGAFYGAGGLERMQGVLANASLSDRIHRKISSLFGDLAMRGEEFVEQMGKLPEKGREIVRSLTQHLSPRDWDLSERAMHALHNIASAPGAAHAFEGSDVDKRLAQLEGEAKGENADQSDSYLSDLQALAHSTRSKIQELVGGRAGQHTEDGEL